MVDVLPPSVRLRHQKYAPFPSRIIDIAESKDDLLARIEAYEKNASVRRLIDLVYLRRQVEQFPSPERLREEMRGNDPPRAASNMLAAMQALVAAAYLDQHGEET